MTETGAYDAENNQNNIKQDNNRVQTQSEDGNSDIEVI